jgi:hypothetical protein
MQRDLIAEHFRNIKDKPFVFIDGFPGRSATMTATELRQIARQINTIATMLSSATTCRNGHQVA